VVVARRPKYGKGWGERAQVVLASGREFFNQFWRGKKEAIGEYVTTGAIKSK
jgi:hypothetical protein